MTRDCVRSWTVDLALFVVREEVRTRTRMETSTLNRAVKIGLHFYGIRPYLPTTLLFRLYWIAALSTAQVFQYRYVIVNVDTDNFSEYMDGVSSAMASSLLFIKLAILWKNQK